MLTARAGSKALIREINEALVLDVVRGEGPVARARIAARTGLSAATVTGITGKLLRAGLLVETDVVRGTGGRPARLLDLGREAVLAAGVRMSPTEAYAVLVDLRGKVVASHREPLVSVEPAVAADAVGRAVASASAHRPSAALLGLGVAISGVVDQAGGTVRHSGSLEWQDVPFQSQLAARLGVPVVIDSYANCVALGLLLFDGRLAGRDLLVFSVGTSLGSSIVVQGQIHRGFDGSAGGFAHSRVWAGDGRPCHCGATDCLETWGSRWGIERELARRGEVAVDLREGGHEVVTAAGERLGVAVANAAKVFGPERVVLAIAPEMDVPALVTRVRRVFAAQYDHHQTPAPHLEVSVVDHSAMARGAGYVLLAQLFTTKLSEWRGPDALPADPAR